MRIAKVVIQNFRCIKNLELDLDETTVLVGPNNAGKTAVLDALRIALTRRWGQSGSGFTEYDIHLADENADPKTSPGVNIEIRVEEAVAGEWPEAIVQDLDDVAQLDPITGRSSVSLQTSFAWDAGTEAFQATWAFLNAARRPLPGRSARRTNLERFWQYLPVFYLNALRDADDEFSPRSQFWGRLLKAIQIPKTLETKVHSVLNRVNRRLLAADPKLTRIAETLTGATKIASRDRDGGVDLRLLPLKSWDLLSKAEIILRNEPSWPWLPLKRHGQGVQSLSVLFLFQSFVEHLLQEIYEKDSTPVLALEEPETHLHPQAARALWSHISALTGQKIITTHSPYFVQFVPFRQLRLLRLTTIGTEVRWLQPSSSTVVPHVAALDAVVADAGPTLEYERTSGLLTLHGKMPEALCRSILRCYGGHAEQADVTTRLRQLQTKSVEFIEDDELTSLETFARRVRGEIFFARRWMLVEGQAEYSLVQELARALGYSFDEHGVALIDAKNCGDPPIFAALARALGIPWLAVFDGDDEGRKFVRSIEGRGFDPTFVQQRCLLLPAGTLEHQLVADGLGPELRQILQRLRKRGADTVDDAGLITMLSGAKTAYAAELVNEIHRDPNIAARMPAAFRDSIGALRGLE